jgi:uncharacterized membrane protein
LFYIAPFDRGTVVLLREGTLEFVIWASRVMHVVGSMVWIGGLVFQNVVSNPVLQYEGEERSASTLKVGTRFVGFVWICAWTMAVTGVILMLLDPRFLWFEYGTRWSVFLGLKQLIFVLLVFYAFGTARLLARLDGADGQTGVLIMHRLRQFRGISILLGLCAAVLAVSM